MAKTKIPRTEQIRMLRSKGMSEKDAVMASMKRTKSETKSNSPKVSMGKSLSEDSYPGGLRIDLEHESLKKLNLKDVPKAGSTVHIHAKGKILHTSTHQDGDKEPRHSVGLQITHMKLSKSSESERKGENDGDETDE